MRTRVRTGALFLAVFLACVIEAVEAVTIVLASAMARHWRSARTGVSAPLAALTKVPVRTGQAETRPCSC